MADYGQKKSYFTCLTGKPIELKIEDGTVTQPLPDLGVSALWEILGLPANSPIYLTADEINALKDFVAMVRGDGKDDYETQIARARNLIKG